jgi:hypothetical protein
MDGKIERLPPPMFPTDALSYSSRIPFSQRRWQSLSIELYDKNIMKQDMTKINIPVVQ